MIKFDLEKLENLLNDFYNLSGITVSIWDADFRQLAYRPKEMPKFCAMIKSTHTGNARCLESDTKICAAAALAGKPVRHICHAGLSDVAAPIVYDGSLLGFMMFGQIVDAHMPAAESFDQIKRRCADLGIDRTALFSAYRELKFSDEHLIASASNILEACTHYAHFSRMIELETGQLASEIDRYISERLDQKISVDTFCAKFNVSKNKLYFVSHQAFKMTVNEYILKKRIAKAKQLLVSTDEPIYIISAKIGVPDYNYFTKVFKKAVGMTPRRYRKEGGTTL
ncbi:MAG: PocR ligand-binding domain-containing protein [Clostridiales bacterium]|jgi:AraC-like DNA-binding protein|nr:PocR ligand-binding domain-containing protein [Clostridiales bacterium]